MARTLVALAVVAMVAGCATQPSIDMAAAKIAATKQQTEQALAQAKTQASAAAVVRHKGPRLNGTEVMTVDARQHSPAALQAEFPYRSASQSFEGVMADIARATGLAVRREGRTQSAAGAQSRTAQTQALRTPGYTWSGTLAGFLDSLARSNELFWRFDEQTREVVFFREETRSFAVFLPTGENSITASISLAGAAGGSSGGASEGSSSSGNVSVSGSTTVNAFASVVMGVRGFVSQEQGGAATQSGGGTGGTGAASRAGNQTPGVIANEGLGMVTVTATPPTLDRIAAYIDNVNKRFARNIYISVRIYNLTVDDEAVSGLSISAAIANLAGTRNATLTPSGLASPASGTPGQFTLRLANAGSSVDIVAQALRSLGNVSLAQSAQVIAANGQPAPFQIADDVTFLESSNTTVVPNVGITTALTPGTRTVGLTGNLLPRFLNDNRILLQYQLNLSSMTLSEVQSGNSKLQTPRISRQALQQQAYLEDGESLVLFGFEQKRSVTDDSTGILTVSRHGGSTRTMVVIVMDVYGDAKAKPAKEAPSV